MGFFSSLGFGSDSDSDSSSSESELEEELEEAEEEIEELEEKIEKLEGKLEEQKEKLAKEKHKSKKAKKKLAKTREKFMEMADDMKDIKKACKVIGQLGGGVPAEGDPEHPRTPGDFSQCHPSLGYDEETGVIKKNEGEEQMWSTALSSTVMQPDTGKYVMKCVVDPPDGESAPNNEIMLGVADEDFDVEGGDPDSQGDENATLGAAFTAKGWGWYVFNGAAYHREGDAEDGKNKVAGNKKWDHTKSRAHAGQRVRMTYDSDKGTLFVHRQGKPLGQLCSGIDGPVRWMVQQQDPNSSVKVKKH